MSPRVLTVIPPLLKVAASFLFIWTLSPPSLVCRSARIPSRNVSPVLVAHSDYYPVVHLRKLHLVRPDLIPYPIYYAIYC